MCNSAGATRTKTISEQFIFLVDNRDGDHRPAKNLKYLKYFTPYHHFKMEGMLKGNNFTFPYKKLLCLIILFKEENM